MFSAYALRTIYAYWWFSDKYYIKNNNNTAALWQTWRIIVSGQIVASRAEFLHDWRRGWRYVRSNVKIAKSLLLSVKKKRDGSYSIRNTFLKVF